jgi:alanyl-tRNA synthetase
MAGFNAAMEAQRARSKASREEVDMTAGGMLGAMAEEVAATEFVGYTQLEGSGKVVGLLVDGRPAQEAAEGEWLGKVSRNAPHHSPRW